jgi:hypothetical protein
MPWKTPLVVVEVVTTDIVPFVIAADVAGVEVSWKVSWFVVLSVFVA